MKQHEIPQRAWQTVGMDLFTFEQRDYLVNHSDGRFFDKLLGDRSPARRLNITNGHQENQSSVCKTCSARDRVQWQRAPVCIQEVPGLRQIVEFQPQDIKSFAPKEQQQGRENSENCENYPETSKRCQDWCLESSSRVKKYAIARTGF